MKFNMEPENQPLKKEIPNLETIHLQGPFVKLQNVIIIPKSNSSRMGPSFSHFSRSRLLKRTVTEKGGAQLTTPKKAPILGGLKVHSETLRGSHVDTVDVRNPANQLIW